VLMQLVAGDLGNVDREVLEADVQVRHHAVA
jgi:hypothetical protein